MSLGTEGFSVADIMALSKDNEGMFGGNGGGCIWLLFILLFWGGGGGYGGFGNRGGAESPAFQGGLTRAELNEGFAMNQIDNGIRGIQHGLCDGFYSQNTAMLTGFNALGDTVQNGLWNVGNALCQGFNGIDRSLADNRFVTQHGFCETNRSIDGLRYENAKNTCEIITANGMNTRDVIDNQNYNSQRVLDFLVENKIEGLRDRATIAELQLSNMAQTQNILSTLQPYPKPAYITCSPYSVAPIPVSV